MSNLVEQKNDEIDLIELIKVLWDKKIWILISTFVFTAIAGICFHRKRTMDFIS